MQLCHQFPSLIPQIAWARGDVQKSVSCFCKFAINLIDFVKPNPLREVKIGKSGDQTWCLKIMHIFNKKGQTQTSNIKACLLDCVQIFNSGD